MGVRPVKPAWTREELLAKLPILEERIAQQEEAYPDARVFPPMTVDECLELHMRYMSLANDRALTLTECFEVGQLLAVFRMAVTAEALGYKGRYVVLNEQDLARVLGA